MKTSDIEYCLNDVSNKKCEGYDRVPVCALFDARKIL